jgi:hypothetical protein
MISQFFVLSPRGDVIIRRDYLGNVPKVRLFARCVTAAFCLLLLLRTLPALRLRELAAATDAETPPNNITTQKLHHNIGEHGDLFPQRALVPRHGRRSAARVFSRRR